MALGVSAPMASAVEAHRAQPQSQTATALPVSDAEADRIAAAVGQLPENPTADAVAEAFFPGDSHARHDLAAALSGTTPQHPATADAQHAWPVKVAKLVWKYGAGVVTGAIKAAKNGAGALKEYLKTTKLARDPSEMQAFINTILEFFSAPARTR
ncbi:hypothetical protein [Streptomyces paromomycinus]|uniref:hypothetical protein n=1 Tax=Streptomyces paromomycinus TaxID=92743 RepID=UPI000F619CBD|nr:hypothetical protein [Streptomyces paromomycinus]